MEHPAPIRDGIGRRSSLTIVELRNTLNPARCSVVNVQTTCLALYTVEKRRKLSSSARATLLPPLHDLDSHLFQPFLCFALWKSADGLNSLVGILLSQRSCLLDAITGYYDITCLFILSVCFSEYADFDLPSGHHPPPQTSCPPTSPALAYLSTQTATGQ